MPEGKPKADELLELAEDTIDEYGSRDTMFSDLEKYYFLDQDKADKAADEEGIEVVRLPYGTNAIDLIQDLLGDAELGIVVPAASEGKRAKALADSAEKYLLAVMHQSEKAQKQSFLSRAAWLVGVRGCIAGRVMGIEKWMEKMEDGTWQAGQRVPLLLQLRDPLYVYPSFGLDGLSYVIERRTRTVKDLRRSLGEDTLPDRELTDKVEWTEYWDDQWFCYWADGQVVSLGAGAGPWPHRYGGIPYAYEFARQTARLEPDKRVRPLLKAVQTVIDRLGLLDSAEATFILDYNGDALMVYSDEEIEIDKRSGAVNYLGREDRVDWLRASRQPLELEQAHTKYSGHLQRGTFPDTMYGMDPGRVVAGYAINLLSQSGQVRINPIIKCVERFMEELLEHALMISENYLTDLLGGPIPFHLVKEVETDEGERIKTREEQTLDAKQFNGWYQVEVGLGELMPTDEQANLMLALKARELGPDNRPLLSWETAVDKWALVSSPADERERIDREAAWNDPQIVALRQALYAAQIKAELEEELIKLDIDPDEVLGRGQAPPMEEAPLMTPPEGPPAGLPPEVLPPQMQGQLLPQPMGGMEEGPEGPPPPTIPRPERYF